MSWSPRPRDRTVQTITFLKCGECGAENSRPFMEGDYVFKMVDGEKCPKCGSVRSRIINIYVPEKKEAK
ncbi:MAG: hypothetical protein QXI97_04065 [Nitrososphaerota archaeon]